MLNRSLLALFLSAMLHAGCSQAPPPSNTSPERCDALPASVRERLDPFVTERMQQGYMPGLSLAILQDGKPVCLKGYGVANLATNEPMTARTRVSIGSSTKPMTALAIMQQVEANKVDLEAPVTRYLPWFRTADGLQDQILVRHLLTHTSGLPSGFAWNAPHDEGALERRVRSLANVKLLFTPGQGQLYANDGFAVLGLIVQTVTGKPFARSLTDSVFTPLGMTQTLLDPVSLEGPDIAQGYVRTRGQMLAKSPPWSSAHAPAGSATYTSAEDAAHYFTGLLAGGEGPGGRVLSTRNLERMWQPLGIPGNGASWFLEEMFHRRAVHHGGNAPNGSSMFLMFPDERVAVGVLNNRNALVANDVARGVAALLFGEEPPPATPVEERAPSTFVPNPRVWQDYVGSFDTVLNRIDVVVDGGRLWADFHTVQPTLRVELEAYGDNDFFSRDDFGALEGSAISFQREPDGGLSFLLSGQPIGKRVP